MLNIIEDAECLYHIIESLESAKKKNFFFFAEILNKENFNYKLEIEKWRKPLSDDLSNLKFIGIMSSLWAMTDFGLKEEILRNIVKNNKNESGYFALVENFFEANFNYIKLNMQEAFQIYKTDPAKTDRLFFALHQNPDTHLSKEHFILAIQLNFITTLKALEDLFTRYRPLKKTFIPTQSQRLEKYDKFMLSRLEEHQVAKIFSFLKTEKFISEVTDENNFFNLLLGKDVPDDFFIIWIDRAHYNKNVNKTTLIDFVNLIVIEENEGQNKFIEKYFKTAPKGIDDQGEITNKKLNNARRPYGLKGYEPSERQKLINDSIGKICRMKK